MATTIAKPKKRTAQRKKTCPHVLAVRKRFGLPQAKFSRIVGVSIRTLANLEQGKKPTTQVRRQITQVDRLQKVLADLVQSDAIGPWMEEPNPAFNELKPIEVIERGEIDRLWGMVYDLRSGSPA